jgi:CHAT domain-containing protein
VKDLLSLTCRRLQFKTLLFLFVFAACDRHAARLDNSSSTVAIPRDSLSVPRADSIISLFLSSNKKSSSIQTSDIERAIALREKVLPNKKLFFAYSQLAELYFHDFKFQIADGYFDKARFLASDLHILPDSLIDIYLLQATCKREIQDFATATSMILNVQDVIKDTGLNSEPKLFETYSLLTSIAFLTRDYELALKYIEQQIAISKKSENSAELSRLYLGQMMTYVGKSEFENALVAVDLSIKHELLASGRSSKRMAIRFMNKSDILKNIGQIDSALAYSYRALRIRKGHYGSKDANIFGAYYAIAKVYLSNNQYDSALVNLQRSMCSLVKDFDALDWKKNPHPAPEEADADLVLALVNKGTVLSNYFIQDSSNIELLKTALSTYLLADSVNSVFRRYALFDDAKLNQMQSAPIDYGKITALSFQLHDLTNEEKYLKSALFAMERSRAAIVQDALQRKSFFQNEDSIQTLLLRHSKLLKTRAELLLELSGSKTQNGINSLNHQLLSLNDAETLLQNQIALAAPGYYNLQFGTMNVSLDELKKKSNDENLTIVEFQSGKESIYSLVISPTAVSHSTIPVTQTLKDDISFFSKAVTTVNGEILSKEHYRRFVKSSHSLYKTLLKNSIGQPAKLVICPDGLLLGLPFEAMLVEETTRDRIDYQLPYLVREFPVTYTQSLNLLTVNNRSEREGSSMLAFGYGKENSAESLKGSEKEIEAIKKETGDVGSYFFEGENASEEVFKRLAVNADIIHMALHGTADTANALQSKIIFPTKSNSKDDGVLFAHELYDLNLQDVDLAVLTSCESGVGKFQTGEGAMSIARGFAYAGCPSIVMSLWKVDDLTTAQVMKSYYCQVFNGTNLGSVLRESKLEYLKSSDELSSHPFYWAALIHIGDTRGIAKTNYMLIGSFVGVISFIILIIYFVRKKRGNVIRTAS